MLELFYSSGLRLSELSSLDVKEGEKGVQGIVRVKGKGNRIHNSVIQKRLKYWAQKQGIDMNVFYSFTAPFLCQPHVGAQW